MKPFELKEGKHSLILLPVPKEGTPLGTILDLHLQLSIHYRPNLLIDVECKGDICPICELFKKPECDICEDKGYTSEICTHCNGSGEGSYDGSSCHNCGGSGEEAETCNCTKERK